MFLSNIPKIGENISFEKIKRIKGLGQSVSVPGICLVNKVLAKLTFVVSNQRFSVHCIIIFSISNIFQCNYQIQKC